MATYPIGCPADPETIAELYIEGSLSPEQTATFEEHLLICRHCQAAVLLSDEYVGAMRSAAREMACICSRCRKQSCSALRPSMA